jgi:chromosome segregation ATPase
LHGLLIQPGQRKRARLFHDPTLIGHTSGPISLTDTENTSHDQRQSPPRSQYEVVRDGGFEHLEHTDEDYQRATQKHRLHTATTHHNLAAESGIVDKIECNNFMCHKRLVVELGPLINFIVGENGSGKSAVLTAITLCLGGKASSTNRGGSLKSFIKEGCDQSILSVKLRNIGLGAFQPYIYGDSITVERHFSKAGASGFKLRNSLGKVVSTKKSDVDDISEWFCLQMDNPLNVLSQDNARQFLNSSTPAQKYKFFVEGVQLQQLDNDYKMVMDLSEELEDKLCEVVDVANAAEIAFNAAQKLRETVTKNVEMREQARQYIRQLAWAKVVDKERVLLECEEKLSSIDNHIRETDNSIADKSHQVEAAEQQVNIAQQALHELSLVGVNFDDHVAQAENEYREAKSELQRIHTDHRNIHDSWKRTADEVRNIEVKIKEEQRRLDEASGATRAQKEKELVEARQAEKNALDERSKIRDRISSLEDLKKQTRKSLDSLTTGEVRRIGAEISRTHRQMKTLDRDVGSVWDGFPKGMEQLVANIEVDTSFREKPIGPLGVYIRLTKPEWSDLIEAHLGETLNAFIVTSLADQKRLANLAARLKVPCHIMIGNHHAIELRNEPDMSLDTILRVCQFDSDTVCNQLIINNFIDQTLLTEDRDQALDILTKNGDLSLAITYKNSRRLEAINIKTNHSRGFNIKPMARVGGNHPRMKTDVESRSRAERERARMLSHQLRLLESEQEGLKQVLSRIESDIDVARADERRFDQRFSEAQLLTIGIQGQLDDLQGANGRLNALIDQLNTRQTAAADEGTQFGFMEVHRSGLSAKVEQLKARLAEVRRKRDEFVQKVQNAEIKVKRYDDARKIALAEKYGAIEGREGVLRDKIQCEEERHRCANEVQQLMVEAIRCSSQRIDISEQDTVHSIERRYQAIESQLNQRERSQGATDEQINERAERAKVILDEHRRTESVIKRELDEIKLSLSQRLEKWRTFQRQITARTRVQFSYLLSERRYRGDILFDHPARRLALAVEPDESKSRPGGRNTRTLSGGEKSFSSICMLLAIWEAMGSPIRCLDEFDVFMDNVNRAISTNMLIEAARQSVSRQYILITPNAIEGRAQLDHDVKLIRLTDPRQQTIPDMVGHS